MPVRMVNSSVNRCWSAIRINDSNKRVHQGARQYENTHTPSHTLQPQTAHLWIVGGGIAGMSVAAFAIRDGGVPARHIHILEETAIPGGSMDGGAAPNAPAPQTWVTRGGRMLTDETYLCLWVLFESIPSLEDPTVSVREECRQFNAMRTPMPRHASSMVSTALPMLRSWASAWGTGCRCCACWP